MATLNEVKYAALLAETGATRPITINELEATWLKSRGHSGSINEMWIQEFELLGITEGTWNERAFEYLGLAGSFARDLNERWYQFWVAGGQSGPELISNAPAIAANWTPRGSNTVTDNIPAGVVEIAYVDDTEGAYLRLSTTTILSEALVDGNKYRIAFTSKTGGSFYIGLTSNPGAYIMQPGINGAEFKALGSTDLAASFLNISLPDGAGQVEAIGTDVRVWKIP